MINLPFQDENIGWKHSVPGGPCFSFPFQISVCFYTILQTTKPGPLKNFRISYMTIRATHLHAKFGVDSTYPGKVWIYGICQQKTVFVTSSNDNTTFWIFPGSKSFPMWAGKIKSSLSLVEKGVQDSQPLKECLLFHYVFEICHDSIILVILQNRAQLP